MLMKFALVVLALCVGVKSQRPSSAEFNLFCRILEEAERMLADVKDYVYDESKDREILEEMGVLFNATTDNMDEFRKTLWVTKDFFKAHPPPTDAGNRKKAHREIGNLIDKGEKKIQDSRKVAEKVNEKMKEAKLSVAQGLYGENVTEVPKDEGNWTKVRNNTGSVFVSNTSAKESCGNESTTTGKTLFNDLFCLCVGEGGNEAKAPCNGDIVPPKNRGYGGKEGSWTQLKYGGGGSPALSLAESIKKIEEVCSKNKEDNLKRGMLGLLKEFEDMIEKGTKDPAMKKIFGHSGRRNKKEVTTCDGSGGSKGNGDEKGSENICVDYTRHFKDNKYEIPWHEKFKNYSTLMKQAKKLEDQILKNRADLLLLKSQAWVAYSREKDDEATNLDDMNVSNLFDATQPPSSFPSFPFLFPFLFLIL
ncbi:Variant surface glycoprotein [Trypanosoma congolense IL3000]|uniref:Variant surface glycoprotein n=1 Tax=Trypanosoma congolense (strain IL3000) TaxID=1068625 RepID=F9WCA5_TRYCI|nr:Variant surface glycoprotein [Trypanosoma congolense IL3000]